MTAKRVHDGRSVDERIEDAVFSLMETTDIPDIRVADVIRLAGVSRSTFYRHFDSVDDVVKAFETDLLANMHSINSFALKARFAQAELDHHVSPPGYDAAVRVPVQDLQRLTQRFRAHVLKTVHPSRLLTRVMPAPWADLSIGQFLIFCALPRMYLNWSYHLLIYRFSVLMSIICPHKKPSLILVIISKISWDILSVAMDYFRFIHVMV